MSNCDSWLPGVLVDNDACVKCGICKAECVLYRIFRDETWSPRGKMILLEAVVEGRLKETERLYNILGRCLFCGKCSLGCSKGVETLLFFAAARYMVLRKQSGPFLHSDLMCDLERKYKCVYPEAQLTRRGDGVSFRRYRVRRGKGKVGLFLGCLGDYVFHRYADSLVRLIRQASIDEVVVFPPLCCGLFSFLVGDWKTFYAIMQEVLAVLQFDSFDCIVTPCMDCKFALSTIYPKVGGRDCFSVDILSPIAFFCKYNVGVDLKKANKGDILGRHKYTGFFHEEDEAINAIAVQTGLQTVNVVTGYEGMLKDVDPFNAEMLYKFLENSMLSYVDKGRLFAVSFDDVFNVGKTQVNCGYILDFL